ncbi:MAG TPA: ABC transporter permease [Thermoanaerobaculia bacterium]|nr:ABC transporter permease [Thermoanaerobaculia bacterium]
MNLWFDLKYAWRLLMKARGHFFMCASVVALSVGLAVWTYALTYSQMFQPLGYPGSEQWYSIQLGADAAGRVRPSVDAYTYQQILKRAGAVDHLGALSSRAAVLSEGQATTSLRAAAISPRLLAATRVAPLFGRMFEEKDGKPGSGAVAIISFDTWQRYFAGDNTIIGKTARIDAAPVQIIGVMPRDFLAFSDYEIWMPLHIANLARPQDSTMTVTPLIIVRDKQTLATVDNELKAVVKAVNGEHPRLFNAGRHAGLIPAQRMYTHGSRPIVTVMSIMALGVLLLGCVNISMVFFARLLERSRELALRVALGASRGRLLRQSLLETALVVFAGLVAGYGLAYYGVEWTHTISSFGSRVLGNGRSTNVPTMRWIDIVAAVVAAIVVWLLSTLIPAWRISRQDAASVLAGTGKGATLRGSNKSVGLLVGLQVIISCLVLIASGNMVLAIKNETAKPLGINTARVLFSTFPTTFDQRYAEPSRRVHYWDDLKSAIANKVPGAEIAFTSAPPTRPVRMAAAIETREDQSALTLPVTVVSEDYFRAMGVRLRSGRLFDSTDHSATLPVAVVDENMAARYWPNQDAIGKRVRLNDSNVWLTIVGVVANVRSGPYRPEAEIGTLYQSMRQATPQAFHILVKLPKDGVDSRPALRAAAFGVDRDLPLHNLQRFDEILAAINGGFVAMIKVFTIIGAITALLAASGLFGLISRSVAQRTQEVGIRRALGATEWRATSMFRRQGALYLSVSMVGLALGIMIMPLLSRAIPNILDRVVPVTFGVICLMAVVISCASYLPTRRAVALEPGDALRYE